MKGFAHRFLDSKAVMSYAFVMIYATLHTRSPFLALVGLFLVMLSIPATLAVFVLVSGSGEFSFLVGILRIVGGHV